MRQRSGMLHSRFCLPVNDVVEKAAELAAVKIEVLYLVAEQIKQGWQQSKLPHIAPCRLGQTPSNNNSISHLCLWYGASCDSSFFLWQGLLITENWPWKSLSCKGQQTDVDKKETWQMFEWFLMFNCSRGLHCWCQAYVAFPIDAQENELCEGHMQHSDWSGATWLMLDCTY